MNNLFVFGKFELIIIKLQVHVHVYLDLTAAQPGIRC